MKRLISTDNKILTIIVPAYNMQWCIEKNLRTYADNKLLGLLSVIVLDNSSTDGTFRIAQKFASEYPQIFTCIRKANNGYGSSVNMGLSMAIKHSKYVRIIDADDWVDTSSLINFINHLENCSADIVQTSYTKIDFVTGQALVTEPQGMNGQIFNVCELYNIGILPCLHSSTFKSELLARHNFRLQENTFYVDEELAVLPFFFAKDICVYHDNVYQYLINNSSQSTSTTNMIKYLSDRERVIVRLMEEYEHTDLPVINSVFCFSRIALSVGNHYTTLYMLHPERAEGRRLANKYTCMLKAQYPFFYKKVRKKD